MIVGMKMEIKMKNEYQDKIGNKNEDESDNEIKDKY